MRVLRVGSQGIDVRQWKVFLVGSDLLQTDVDDTFDESTKAATAAFQSAHGLSSDGVVGPATLAYALHSGFNPMEDTDDSETGPNWPPRPTNMTPFGSNDARAAAFGKFSFEPLTDGNIKILGGWIASNITTVEIPQLKGILGAPSSCKVFFHNCVAESVVSLFQAWEEAELISRIQAWAGSFVPRFQRGSTTALSNHAWGTAFDINAPWNGLGREPALKGQTGCVRELVQIANSLGWFWGGHFSSRKDGMHFEFAVNT